MPHSSGGGSHSGGSSSSSSSSGGSGHSIRTSSTYFPGAHQYVQYKNGKPTYIYSESKTLNQSSPLRFFLLIFYLPFLFTVWIKGYPSVVNIPQRLPLKYDTSICIEDNLEVVENYAQLQTELDSFLDLTGISVALITDTNAEWEDYYMNMETYAYDMYVQRFPDESHWLIVYTTDCGEDFDDWHFHGMQGDDTDNILTSRITGIFNDKMTKYLMQEYSVDRSLEKALADIRATGLMNIYVNWEGAAVIGVISLFLIIHMCFMLRDPNKKYRKYILCSDKVKEEAYCEYCGSAYWPGTILECPNCGAPLKSNSHKQKEKKAADEFEKYWEGDKYE